MWIDDINNYAGDIYLNGTYISDISKIRLDRLIGDNVIRLVPKKPRVVYDVEVKKWLTIIDGSTRSFHMMYNQGIPAPSRYMTITIEKQDSGGYYVKGASTKTNRSWYGYIPYNAVLRMEERK